MEHTDVEDQIAEIIRVYAKRDDSHAAHAFEGICQVNGSHNNVIINIGYAPPAGTSGDRAGDKGEIS